MCLKVASSSSVAPLADTLVSVTEVKEEVKKSDCGSSGLTNVEIAPV